jgi:diadenosine tetraphosphatase ApaH/serine/threonine PP2A family protein phosphatase
MKGKYDELCFSMVVEVFRYLPLVHVIDSKVFVVHGGLFGREGVTLQDIQAIDRTDYTCAPPPDTAAPKSVEDARSLDLKQMMRDCLWSDPKDIRGPSQFNHARRQGQLFGPDVTKSFLRQNNLDMVVRSHEWCVFMCACDSLIVDVSFVAFSSVKLGFDQPYDQSPESLVTVFSASGYSNSNNLGAYITFCTQVTQGSRYFVVGTPDLQEAKTDVIGEALLWTVHDFSCIEAVESLEEANKTSLRAIILRKRQELFDQVSLPTTLPFFISVILLFG